METKCRQERGGSLLVASETGDVCAAAKTAASSASTGSAGNIPLIAGIVGAVAGVALVAVVVALVLTQRRQTRRRKHSHAVLANMQAQLCNSGESELNPLYHSAARERAQDTARSLIEATYQLVFEAPPNDLPPELDPSLVLLRTDIGKGVSATVYSGSFGVKVADEGRAGGMEVKRYTAAFKLLKPSPTMEERQAFLTEAYLLNQFDHAHVIRVLGVVT